MPVEKLGVGYEVMGNTFTKDGGEERITELRRLMKSTLNFIRECFYLKRRLKK